MITKHLKSFINFKLFYLFFNKIQTLRNLNEIHSMHQNFNFGCIQKAPEISNFHDEASWGRTYRKKSLWSFSEIFFGASVPSYSCRKDLTAGSISEALRNPTCSRAPSPHNPKPPPYSVMIVLHFRLIRHQLAHCLLCNSGQK